MRQILAILILLNGVFTSQTIAQRSYSLLVVAVDSNAASYGYKTRFASRAEAANYLLGLPAEMLSKGYLSASVDQVLYDSLSASATIFAGSQYNWGTLKWPEGFLFLPEQTGLIKGKKGKEQWQASPDIIRQKLLDHFEDQGYPFARVGFDSVVIEGSTLHAVMVVDKGPLYKIDSIAQLGTLKMQPGFLNRYLGLPPGTPYRSSVLEKLNSRLLEMPYASQQQPWDLSMLGTGAVVNVYLQPRRSNVLNVLLGLMPASTQTPGNKMLITGDVNMLLRNSFRVGETIGVNWQQIQYQSPRLNLLYHQPYLFKSRVGVDFFFELFKKDSQFVNLQARLGIPYEFSLTQSAKIILLHQQTNVSTVDTNFVLFNGRLPDLAGVSSTSLGIDYLVNTTDYRLNPRRGFELGFTALAGNKKLEPSAEIQNLKDPLRPGFSFGSLYDTVALNTYQMRLKAQAAHYISVGRLSVLKLGINGGWYQSGNYFRNELFQIGGFRLLRGFDEESIFAQSYAVGTFEYRLLTGQNAYFFGFVDGGYAAYQDQNLKFGHSYVGSGLGMAIETKSSVINLSWAIGKRNDLPLDLRNSKIHLGLINFF